MFVIPFLQASRALHRPLTLPTAREAAAVDHNRALQHDQAQAGPNSQPSKASAAAAAVLSAVQTAVQSATGPSGGSSDHTNQHPAGFDEKGLQLSSTTGASSSLKRGAVGTEESQPALETTGVDTEGKNDSGAAAGGGGEAGSSSATPEVTRRTAGDVNRAFGQAPPEVSSKASREIGGRAQEVSGLMVRSQKS